MRVADGVGGEAIQDFTINVRTSPTNNPPAIDSTPQDAATVGKQYRYDLIASDADNDLLLWGLDKAPAGMSIDVEKGTILWTPSADQVGDHEVAVRVTDAFGAYVGQEFTLSVRGVNVAPTIISSPPTVAAVNKVYKYAVVASDLENDALNYSLVNPPEGMTINRETGLIEWKSPSGMTINSTTGVLEWTPTSVGEFEVVVGATDASGKGGAQQFWVTVAANDAPIITSTPPGAIAVGETYRYDVRAVDPNGDVLSYTLSSSPEGMTIDELGRITWSGANPGSYAAEVVVEDTRGARASQSLSLNVVADNTPPRVHLWSYRAGDVNRGEEVTFVVTASDDVGVESLSLLVNGTRVALDGQGRATVPMMNLGGVEAIAQATDVSGNTSTTSNTLRVIESTDTDAPILEISSLEDDVTITNLEKQHQK